MSVIIWKDGEKSLCEAHQLEAQMSAGYTLTKDPDPEAQSAPSAEEADTNGSGKLSVSEIRAAAKEAGIEGWETKRMKTLKQELGYE